MKIREDWRKIAESRNSEKALQECWRETFGQFIGGVGPALALTLKTLAEQLTWTGHGLVMDRLRVDM